MIKNIKSEEQVVDFPSYTGRSCEYLETLSCQLGF